MENKNYAYYTISEYAERIKKSTDWVRQEIAQGRLAAYRFGKSIRIDCKEAEAYEANNTYKIDY